MKQYNKTHCPESITYNNEVYKLNVKATHEYSEGLQLSSRYHIKVNVLSKHLKGRIDLHGKPYTHNVFIYSNELGLLRQDLPVKILPLQTKAYKKAMKQIKTFGY